MTKTKTAAPRINFTGFRPGDKVRLSTEAIDKMVEPRRRGQVARVTGGSGQIVGIVWLNDERPDGFHKDFLERV